MLPIVANLWASAARWEKKSKERGKEIKKYKLLVNEHYECMGHRLYRIQALVSFSDVKKGDKGGYVESEANLSQKDFCWLYGSATVLGEAKVEQFAKVKGMARVTDRAVVRGGAVVLEHAHIYGDAVVKGWATVMGQAQVCNNAVIDGHAKVDGKSLVCDKALVCDNATVTGSASVTRDAVVKDHAVVMGNADVTDSAVVRDNATVGSYSFVDGDRVVCGEEKVFEFGPARREHPSPSDEDLLKLTEFEKFVALLGHLTAVRNELDDTLRRIHSKETDAMFCAQVGKTARVSWKRALDGSDMMVEGLVNGYANGMLQVEGYNVDIMRLTEFEPLEEK